MPLSIALVLIILAGAVFLLVTEKMRPELVAIFVMLALALTGVITHSQALEGFSDQAVITIAALLVLSGGLSRTGVAHIIGRRVLRLAGDSETRLVIVMMATVGLLSGIMQDIGVAALMLPVVVEIARRIDHSPSKLLMPLAFASLLGGMTTLIGTAPNLLVSGALREAGLDAFQMFDFLPVGLAALAAGMAYMAIAGRRFLPERDLPREAARPAKRDLKGVYGVDKVLFSLTLPEGSPLSGKSVAQSHLGSALGLNLLAVVREGETRLSPAAGFILRSGDKLVVEGRLQRLRALRGWKHLVMESERPSIETLASGSVTLAEADVAEDSPLAGKTLADTELRRRYSANVLALVRDGLIHLRHLLDYKLQEGDRLLLLGQTGLLEQLDRHRGLSNVAAVDLSQAVMRYDLERRLMSVQVPQGSLLAGRMLADTRLGDAFGLTVLGITRNGETRLLPDAGAALEEGDKLLIEGSREGLEALDALQRIRVDESLPTGVRELESEEVGLAEIMLSPGSSLAGRTLRQADFRERYGLTVVAVWREGRAYHTNLRDMELRLGDALLVHGPRRRLRMLTDEPDLILLTKAARGPLREEKAPLAAGIMAGVLLLISLDLLPPFLAAVCGAALMVFSGCLAMDEVYRVIEWKAILMISGMLSMGKAMEQSGAAALLAQEALGTLAQAGPYAVVAGLFLITAASAQVMPTAAVAVLMAPIALSSASELGLSPHALLMTVALASSCAFLTPVAHPVNLLVMGLGGYRFTDYTRVGLPLLLVVFLVVLLVLPLVWPLAG